MVLWSFVLGFISNVSRISYLSVLLLVVTAQCLSIFAFDGACPD